MNNDPKRAILNKLLDKYEKTAAYKSGGRPDRRVLLELYGKKKTEFTEYDIESFQKRTQINSAVRSLADSGLIFYEWFKGEEEHIIERVWLNIDNVDEAYRYVGRTSAKEAALSIISELEEQLSHLKTDWIVSFYKDAYDNLVSKLKQSGLLPETAEKRAALYTLLSVIDEGSFTQTTERVLSEKCFGDSKYFERELRPVLLSIMRKYISREMTDRELLQSVGISRYPEPLEFRGSIIINGLDMSKMTAGTCIYSSEIADVTVDIPERVRTVITIENRANYFAYHQKSGRLAEDSKIDCAAKSIINNKVIRNSPACAYPPDVLVIFHGGQYSPSKKLLFQKIANAMPENCTGYHWGDIDLGEFSMLLRLRREITPAAKPYRMDSGELEKYHGYTQPFDKEYGEKLKKLLLSELLSDCRECIELMLSEGIKLEQEAMLT